MYTSAGASEARETRTLELESQAVWATQSGDQEANTGRLQEEWVPLTAQQFFQPCEAFVFLVIAILAKI